MIVRWPILAVALAVLNACASIDNANTADGLLVFPAESACTYPAAYAAGVLQQLGTSTWTPVETDREIPQYACTGGERSVGLYSDASSFVEVKYAASGTSLGASVLELTYSATGTGPVPNESTTRNMFANLARVVAGGSLGFEPDEYLKKRIMNLESYPAIGAGYPEILPLGTGFMTLTREASESRSRVSVVVRYYPDRITMKDHR